MHERSRDHPRQRLIEAMIEVAAREGYAGASVAEVIAGAGASRSTFYEHFADRDECFLAALAEASGSLHARVDAALRGGDEPAQATASAVVRFAVDLPAAARVLFCESLACGPSGLAVRDELIDALAERIERAWASREPRLPAPDVPSLGLICGLFRLLSMRLTAGEAALDGLEADLAAWIASHERESGPLVWRAGTPLGAITTQPAQAAPAAPPPQTLPRGRHGLSPAQVARSQRQRILAAVASESFAKGYSNVTVREIVTAASIARNVFYAQFSDRREAAIAALQDGFERALAATAGTFFTGESWPARIWSIGQRLTEHYLAHPADAYLSFVELHAIGPEAVSLAHERLRVFALLLEEGYRLRAEAGKGPLPRTVSEALVATVLELGFRQAPRRGATRRRVLLGQQAYMCLAPFIGVDEACELVAERTGVALEARQGQG